MDSSLPQACEQLIASMDTHTAFHANAALTWYSKQLAYITGKEKNRMMLYPDMTRDTYEASDHFIFAAPCTQSEWFDLLQLESIASQSSRARDTNNYLPWCILEDDCDEKIYVIIRDRHDTDEAAEITAAWIRVSEEFRGMIYAVKYDPGYGSSQTLAQIICRTAGVPPSQVRHVTVTRRNNV